jgi:hypothetical protein
VVGSIGFKNILGLAFEETGVTSVEDEKQLPTEFVLKQNYPNPFNPSTSIQYTVGCLQFVNLTIYDVLGREVSVLVSEEKPAGRYEIGFNAVGLSSGVYFYKLQSGNFIETKKMILIR